MHLDIFSNYKADTILNCLMTAVLQFTHHGIKILPQGCSTFSFRYNPRDNDFLKFTMFRENSIVVVFFIVHPVMAM